MYPHHITISVQNLGETIEWWKRNFGFSLIIQFRKDSMKANVAFIGLGDFFIEIFEFDKHVIKQRKKIKPSNFLRETGIKYLAFGVDNVDEAYDELIGKGVVFVQEPILGSSNHKYAIFLDNNGFTFELFEEMEKVG